MLGAATAAAAVTGFACAQTAPQNAELTQKWKDRSMYTIQTRTLEGQPANLADYLRAPARDRTPTGGR